MELFLNLPVDEGDGSVVFSAGVHGGTGRTEAPTRGARFLSQELTAGHCARSLEINRLAVSSWRVRRKLKLALHGLLGFDLVKQREEGRLEIGIRKNQALVEELHERSPAGMIDHAVLLGRGRDGRHPRAVRK